MVAVTAIKQKRQYIPYGSDVNPDPYSFEYKFEDETGGSSRQEEGDASGAVKGSYTVEGEDGKTFF